jgi:TRAP transporter T-component
LNCVQKKMRRFPAIAVVILALALSGCSAIIQSQTRPILDNLVSSIMKQSDPELVKDGAPAYMLLIDGLIEGSPDNPDMLKAAASLYSAYGSAFTGDDPERAKMMAKTARDYANRAVSLENEVFAERHALPFSEFEPVVLSFKRGDEVNLFMVISTWAGYIQTHSSNWDNVADVAKIRVLAERLLELDESYYYGSGHLVMGVLDSLLPPALGGKPEVAKNHFERAVELSEGKFLQAQVMYAKSYAKLVFDRETHDRLLNQVMDTPADVIPELTLVNTLAKREAEKLLAEADDYF